MSKSKKKTEDESVRDAADIAPVDSHAKLKIAIFAVTLTVALLAVALVVANSLFFSVSTLSLTDKSGKAFAEYTRNGKKVTLECTDKSYEDYAALCLDEAVGVFKKKYKLSESEAKDKLFSEAEIIKTALDTGMQKNIVDAYKASKLDKSESFSGVVTDTAGRIIASYGVTVADCSGSTSALHYPCSAIKPLSVYIPAFESGKVNWSTMVTDTPLKTVVSDDGTPESWPVNANGKYSGENTSIHDALCDSTNTVAVKVLKKVSINKTLKFLTDNFSIDLEYEKLKSKSAGSDEILGNIALGYLYKGVSPVDMAGFYQIFPTGGKYTAPYVVLSINSSDKAVYTAAPKSKQVVSSDTAAIMTRILQDAVKGDSTGNKAYLYDTPVGGKTGTSSGYMDNWFVGFTPEYTCAVWHGSNTEKPISENKAASIFAAVFSNVPSDKNAAFPYNNNIREELYCKKSGKLKSQKCKSVTVGHYSSKNIPGICTECK